MHLIKDPNAHKRALLTVQYTWAVKTFWFSAKLPPLTCSTAYSSKASLPVSGSIIQGSGFGMFLLTHPVAASSTSRTLVFIFLRNAAMIESLLVSHSTGKGYFVDRRFRSIWIVSSGAPRNCRLSVPIWSPLPFRNLRKWAYNILIGCSGRGKISEWPWFLNGGASCRPTATLISSLNFLWLSELTANDLSCFLSNCLSRTVSKSDSEDRRASFHVSRRTSSSVFRSLGCSTLHWLKCLILWCLRLTGRLTAMHSFVDRTGSASYCVLRRGKARYLKHLYVMIAEVALSMSALAIGVQRTRRCNAKHKAWI